jgi:hypothetical protein
MLIQATKALRGKDTIHFKVHDNEFEVFTSPSQGSIKLQYVEQPTVFRPPKDEPFAVIKVDDMAELVDGIAAATSFFYDTAQFHPAYGRARLMSTDRHRLFQLYLPIDTGALPDVMATHAGFWNALQGATSHGELRFCGNGLRVRFDNFEAYTPFTSSWPFKDYESIYFPEGTMTPLVVKLDRKNLLSLLKGVKESIKIVCSNVSTTLEIGKNSVALTPIGLSGEGLIWCSAPYLYSVLDAIDDKSIVIGASGNPLAPYKIGGLGKRGRFLLAPIVKK